ncbi:hypothetical protein [Pendulispora albinea]|uniref:Uncharacterized protein n=1 Tax=Pendulispora albinea TaxID=2741071 RepID=A0ABZ2LYZ2_9BACT
MMTRTERATMLENARSAVRGDDPAPRLHVIARTDGRLAIAFLVTLLRADGDLVLPLSEGKNLVGRMSDRLGLTESWPRPYAVESAQWVIECQPGQAEVYDAASTNLSILLPREFADDAPLQDGIHSFEALTVMRGAIPLPHPNAPSERHRYPLREGDVLRGMYASLLFGWMRPPR